MSSSSSNIIMIDVNYNGIFSKNPLNYSLGAVQTIDQVDFGGMNFNDLVEFLEKLTRSKCSRLYYCVPRNTLSTGLRIIECDLDIYRFSEVGVANGRRISLYVDHCDENLTDFVGKDKLTDLIMGVDSAMSDTGSEEDSDPSYQLSGDEDDISDSISLAQDDDDDDDNDDDVSTLNQTINDPFLTRLCYDNMDDDVVEQADSDENMSANEEDDDSDGVEKYIERGVIYPSYDPSINWKSTKPILGMMFESCKQLKESLIDYGVSNGYQLVFPVNDYKRLLVRCGKEEIDYEKDDVENNDEKEEDGVENNAEKGEDGVENNVEKEEDGVENNDEKGKDGVENNDEKEVENNDEKDGVGKKIDTNRKKKVRKCPFRLWASKITDEGSFQIKSLNDKHICSRKFSLGSLITHSWIAKRYFRQLIQNPHMSIRAIQTDIMRKYKCKVSTGQCSRAKKKALLEYEGGLKEHYAKLWDYGAEILETNPGSTVKMSVNRLDGNIYFSSYYICFKGIKDGWINGCRKVIGLDGCFLKSVCEGQLLSAMGRDANNHIFPIAWAVVSVENKENWKWFLTQLRDDIGMIDGAGLTLISDQHKGILEAVKDIFPYAEHRQCTRHIYANFKKKFRGMQFKNLFWAAANSTTKQHFEDKMKELKAISNDAYNHLIERNPKSWSRAFFEVNRACDAFENGMSESFNSRIRIARRKPIITMLEEIRTYVMLRNFKKAEKAAKLEHEVCPSYRKTLEKIKVKQRHWSVIPSDYNVFEARNEYGSFVVDIRARTCSCRSWQLSGIPCVHTVAALAFLNKDPETYVSDWLKKDMFKEAYKYAIRPLKGSSFWPKTNDIEPLPPKERRMPGRPTVNRKRDASERERKYSKVGFGRKMTCQKCRGKGHNSRSCKKQKTDPPPKEVRPRGRSKRVVAPTSARASTSGAEVGDQMVGQ
ncbi:hypothetical protein Tco_0584086 [Tanacetum coccineum]